MTAQANPFLDPGDGHVLADDMEKRRQTFWGKSTPQLNPFITGTHPVTGKLGYGVPVTSPNAGKFARGEDLKKN